MGLTRLILEPVIARLFKPGTVDIVPPDELWCGLAIAEPPADGASPGAIEVPYGIGYRRLDVTGAWDYANHKITNAAELEWPTAIADWPVISYLFIASNSLIGYGQVYATALLPIPISIEKDGVYKIKRHTIEISLL